MALLLMTSAAMYILIDIAKKNASMNVTMPAMHIMPNDAPFRPSTFMIMSTHDAKK